MDPSLQEELIETLRKYREGDKKAKGRMDRAVSIINSPCFLTLIAGIILAVISSWISAKFAREAENRQNHQAAIVSKKTAMRDFGEGIVRFTQNSNGMRKRQIWLALNQNKPDKDLLKYPDGRSFKETRDIYEKQFADFNLGPQADALCAYTKAIFVDDSVVTEKITSLDKNLDTYISTDSYSALSDCAKIASELHAEILNLMGRHIHKLEQEKL